MPLRAVLNRIDLVSKNNHKSDIENFINFIDLKFMEKV